MEPLPSGLLFFISIYIYRHSLGTNTFFIFPLLELCDGYFFFFAGGSVVFIGTNLGYMRLFDHFL